MKVNTKKYNKYKFCRAVDCKYYYPENFFEKENCSVALQALCPFSAKDLYNWLRSQGYEILKKNKDEY